jgi:hypothetical protein
VLNSKEVEEVKKDISAGVFEALKQRKLGSYEVIPLLQKTISNVMEHKDPNKMTEGEMKLIENCLEQVILNEVPIEVLVKHKIGLLVKGFYDFVHTYPRFKVLDIVARCAFKKLKKCACEELFGDSKVLYYSPKSEQAQKSLSKKSLPKSKGVEAMEVKGDTKHEDEQVEKQKSLYQICKESLRSASLKVKRKKKVTKKQVVTKSEAMLDLSNKAEIKEKENPRAKLRSFNDINKSIRKRSKEITKRIHSKKSISRRTRSETGAIKKNNSKKALIKKGSTKKKEVDKSVRKENEEPMEDVEPVKSKKRSQSAKPKKKEVMKGKRSVSANPPKRKRKNICKTPAETKPNKSKKKEEKREPMEDVEVKAKKFVKKTETAKSQKKTKRDSSIESINDKKPENSKLLTTQKESKSSDKKSKKVPSNKQDEPIPVLNFSIRIGTKYGGSIISNKGIR